MTTRYDYFLSPEEHPPHELVRQARAGQMLTYGFHARQVLPRLREG